MYCLRCTNCILLVLCIGVLTHAAGCTGGPPPPNVILIVMDTARADHFSCYGYDRPTSPHIDRFASTSTLFTRAQASASWTLPSHASLFTGMDSFQHGARTLEGSSGHGHVNVNPLSRDHFTLAEMFAQQGYNTAAVVSNDVYLSRRWQLDQGFETYIIQKGWGHLINEHVFKWIQSAAKKPFFLFINYMDTHVPYNTTGQPDFIERYVDYDGGMLAKQLDMKAWGAKGRYPEDLETRVIDQYDTAVFNLDTHVGDLLAELARHGFYDDALVIVTSDHGESFGEHGVVAHGKDIYQPEISVPLIVKYPNQTEPRRSDDVITSSDIARLILGALPQRMVKKYEERFPNTVGNHPPISEQYYVNGPLLQHPDFYARFNRVRTAVFDWPLKYIDSSDGAMELYDLVTDPGEAANLIERETAKAQGLAERLDLYQDARGRSTTVVEQPPMSLEELKRLRALGYIR